VDVERSHTERSILVAHRTTIALDPGSLPLRPHAPFYRSASRSSRAAWARVLQRPDDELDHARPGILEIARTAAVAVRVHDEIAARREACAQPSQ
jgi:hypothetical protein